MNVGLGSTRLLFVRLSDVLSAQARARVDKQKAHTYRDMVNVTRVLGLLQEIVYGWSLLTRPTPRLLFRGRRLDDTLSRTC
jgi:hypothetical protein